MNDDLALHYASKSGTLLAELTNVRTTIKVALDLHDRNDGMSRMVRGLLADVEQTLAKVGAAS